MHSTFQTLIQISNLYTVYEIYVNQGRTILFNRQAERKMITDYAMRSNRSTIAKRQRVGAYSITDPNRNV